MTWEEIAKLRKAITKRRFKLIGRLRDCKAKDERIIITSELNQLNKKAQELAYTEKVLADQRRAENLKRQKENNESDFKLFKNAVYQLDTDIYMKAWKMVDEIRSNHDKGRTESMGN